MEDIVVNTKLEGEEDLILKILNDMEGKKVEETENPKPKRKRSQKEIAADSSEGNKIELKRRPWSIEEDAILVQYVTQYGEGDWNKIQKNTSLARCGKSCRFRWMNYLRPNLKKEAFSQQEEEFVVRLHAMHGNKWALMASKLPGRTDNEVKNFWNAREKRLKRLDVPVYRSDVCFDVATEIQDDRSGRSIQNEEWQNVDPNMTDSSQLQPINNSCLDTKQVFKSMEEYQYDSGLRTEALFGLGDTDRYFLDNWSYFEHFDEITRLDLPSFQFQNPWSPSIPSISYESPIAEPRSDYSRMMGNVVHTTDALIHSREHPCEQILDTSESQVPGDLINNLCPNLACEILLMNEIAPTISTLSSICRPTETMNSYHNEHHTDQSYQALENFGEITNEMFPRASDNFCESDLIDECISFFNPV